MAQFDVYDMGQHGLVVDCQNRLLEHLRSRFVVPLRPAGDLPAISPRFNPEFELNGATYVLATQFPRAIDLARLGNRIGSLADHDLTIKNALDMLISGF
jgi:toxin CcdB